MKKLLPNLFTVAGLIAGLVGLVLWPAPAGASLLGLSLIIDIVDGHVARELGVASELGAALDWSTDVALSHAIAWRCFPPAGALALSALLVGVQSLSQSSARLISGRAAISLTLFAGLWWP